MSISILFQALRHRKNAVHAYPHYPQPVASRLHRCEIAGRANMITASMMDAAYRRILKPIFFGLDAETAHHLTLAILSSIPPLGRTKDPPELAVHLWGRDFSNPIGLAAGMDKDALAVHGWEMLGFGFAELGTITPRLQAGNDRPRIWRLYEQRSLINRLGFPSEGMEAVAARIERLQAHGLKIRLALNFGPNSNTTVDSVVADYAALMTRMGTLADFIVVNVSSPNTTGLREWQTPEKMREIFAAMREHAAPDGRAVPVLVKIAPDLDRQQLLSICDTALELELDGIVACNTTIGRESFGVSSRRPGGLSGPPLLARSRELVRDIHIYTHGKIPIVGVGGIASAEDAWLHIRAGASLIELYTGLVYEGPGLVARIKSGLLRLLRREGFRSISEAVGIDR
jgi:dihydroorotate dehydrogenase